MVLHLVTEVHHQLVDTEDIDEALDNQVHQVVVAGKHVQAVDMQTAEALVDKQVPLQVFVLELLVLLVSPMMLF